MSESRRKAQIIEAVERLLARGGVDAVTMRAVAGEAGVSLRLVQYYGKSKDELLTVTLDGLAGKSAQKWRARTQQVEHSEPLNQVAAFFEEALPRDPESQGFHRVGVSLEALAITRPGIAGQAYQKHLSDLAEYLTDTLCRDTHLDGTQSRLIALEVMALAHGLGTLLMADQLSQPEAQALVKDYLERLRPRLAAPPSPAATDAEPATGAN